MSGYVNNLYGSLGQQVDGALVPNSVNMNTGNLIQTLPGVLRGGKRSRKGGNMLATAIPPLTILAMQQLYGRKSRQRRSGRKGSRRFRRRTYRTR